MWAGRGGRAICICGGLVGLGRGWNILGTHEAFLDTQSPIVTDGQNHASDSAIFVRVRQPFALQGFDLAEARLNGVVFFRFSVSPILAVILRRQFFLARDETLFLGKQVRVGFYVLRIDPPETAKRAVIHREMHLDPFPLSLEKFGRGLQLLDGEALEEVRVFHMGAGTIVEEIAQENPTRRLICFDADKAPEGRVRRMGGLGQLTFDALRMDVVTALHRVPDRQLAVMVVGQREGHDAFEGQITGTKLLDDFGCDTGEFEATAHQVDGDAEFQRNLVLAATLVDHLVESLELVCRVHRRALEVFGGRGEDGVALIFDEAGYRVVSRDHTVFGELLQRLEATTTRIDGKTCLRQRMNHQVLLDTGLADAGEKLGVVADAGGNLADIERARPQLVEGDHPDVGSAVRRCRSCRFGFLRRGRFRSGRGLGHGQVPCHAGPG